MCGHHSWAPGKKGFMVGRQEPGVLWSLCSHSGPQAGFKPLILRG